MLIKYLSMSFVSYSKIIQSECCTGTDPGFQVGGGAYLKKLCRSEGGTKIFGAFRVKNHDFTPKNHIFSNLRGGACRVCPPPGSAPAVFTIYNCAVF